MCGLLDLVLAPDSVARAIFDGVEKGEEEIFPDPMSASMYRVLSARRADWEQGCRCLAGSCNAPCPGLLFAA